MASAMNKTSGGRLGLMKPRAVGAIVIARRPATASNHSEHSSHQGDHECFAQHQLQHPTTTPTDCAQNSDFTRSLEDRHQHRVEHADRAEDERDGSRRPGHGLRQADLGIALHVVASRRRGNAADR